MDSCIGKNENKYTLGASFKMRKCMNPSCNKTFLSSGPHNRFCSKCREKTDHGIKTHNLHI